MFFHMMRVDYPGGWDKVKELDFDKIARIKRELYQVDIEWIVGSFGTFPGEGYLVSFNTPHFKKYQGLEDFDYIREYLPYAKKYGIKLVSYLNLHWFSYEFGKEHFDWQQITCDGKIYGEKYPLYGNGTTFCINSPFREWAFKMIEEVLKTGIDGVFLDGPVIFPESCYCKYCEGLFRKYSGKDFPEWGNWSDPVWKEFLLFRRDSFIKFMKDARDTVKKIKKEGIIFINSSYLPMWLIPRYIGDLEEYQDFNLAEAFYHLGVVKDFYNYYFVAKCLKVSDKPSTAAMHNCAGVWHWIPLYPEEIKMTVAQNLCVRNGIWSAVLNGYKIEDKEYWEPLKELLEKIEKRKEIFERGEFYSQVGLYISSPTFYFYLSEIERLYSEILKEKEENLVIIKEREKLKDKKNLCDRIIYNELIGFFEILVRSHIPFKIVNNHKIDKEINKLKVLILPNCACLSDREIDIMKSFVKNGGRLIITFETGFYDERGERRNKNPFFDVEIEGIFNLANAEQYCILEKGLGGYKNGRLVPRPLYCLKVKGEGEKIMSFIKESKGVYNYFVETSEYPAILRKKCGKGEIVYISSLPGEFYYNFHPVEWENILGEIIIGGDIELGIKIEAPSTLITELYRERNKWLIHLVNSTGDMKRPVSSIVPVDVKIEVNGNYRVETVLNDGVLTLRNNKQTTEIEIKNLRLYEILILNN